MTYTDERCGPHCGSKQSADRAANQEASERTNSGEREHRPFGSFAQRIHE